METFNILNDYQCTITITVTALSCWLLHEILERKCGIDPAMRTTSEFDTIYDSKTDHDKYIMNKRMSRQFDLYRNYRMTPRGSIQFIKGIFSLGICICWTYLFLKNGCKFFIDHFIYFNQESVNNPILKNTCASFVGFYLWELCADKYGKLVWSTLYHHIVTIIAAIIIVFGIYNPFAVWYGYMGVACCFPMAFSMGFRYTFSNKYAKCTRDTFKFLFYFYFFMCVLNFCGQMYLLIYGIITKKIEVWRIATNVAACCIWGYDDYKLARALKDFGTMKYELVDILIGNIADIVIIKKDAYDQEQQVELVNTTRITSE